VSWPLAVGRWPLVAKFDIEYYTGNGDFHFVYLPHPFHEKSPDFKNSIMEYIPQNSISVVREGEKERD
jgi:hypothetical protein